MPADELVPFDAPVHPAIGRALTHTLLAADLTASAGETAHPRIASRMQQSAQAERVEARLLLDQVKGGGDG